MTLPALSAAGLGATEALGIFITGGILWLEETVGGTGETGETGGGLEFIKSGRTAQSALRLAALRKGEPEEPALLGLPAACTRWGALNWNQSGLPEIRLPESAAAIRDLTFFGELKMKVAPQEPEPASKPSVAAAEAVLAEAVAMATAGLLGAIAPKVMFGMAAVGCESLITKAWVTLGAGALKLDLAVTLFNFPPPDVWW